MWRLIAGSSGFAWARTRSAHRRCSGARGPRPEGTGLADRSRGSRGRPPPPSPPGGGAAGRAAPFFLQLFGLITPLFFQVVIDKVLVHRSLSTLDVLVIGLVAIAVFETVVGILRTYLFSHTTNRIDVELGARLFHHLLALPLAYFQARRVGDSVARVRELENIRSSSPARR